MTSALPRDVEHALRAAVRGEVACDAGTRALMTMDASNYRRVPLGVVAPRDAQDVAAALAVCRESGLPVVPRGGGTSIAGQATGTGIVLDLTRHMNRLLDLDPQARTARVQPGLVLDDLRTAAARHGLTFGPDPSTHSRCTLGGMIGNNACGAHSVAWGTTADNVHALDVLTYRAERAVLGGPSAQNLPPRLRDGLRTLADENLALLRTGFPQLPRRISGYALDRLLPEHGRDAARAFTGGEGTLGVLTEATVRLVPAPAARALAVLGYDDESAAAEAAHLLLPLRPLTVEGMAADLVGEAGRSLPRGGAWLFVEVGGDDPDEALAHARRLCRAADGTTGHAVVRDPARQRALWRIREDAAGTATRMPDGSEAWPGWEDCAVPPARLGAYLRDFRALLAEHGLRGAPYGHFGDGCVHARIDFDLVDRAGVARFRRFSAAAADLVVSHGGSLSGEHGDGQARAEFLPRMYGPELIALFADFKDLWDPDGGMNPGMLVRPALSDSNLRFAVLPSSTARPVDVEFTFRGDGADFPAAVRRCVGVAKCRTATVPAGGSAVMCPSFRVTGEERHSTRGRARLLHEMLAGELIEDGWRSAEVRDALDLCLSCKGCRSDCPVEVDMATYKAEFLHHHYRGRLRPRSHYAMGWLPVWLRAAAPFARPLNFLGRARSTAWFAKWLGGIARQRAFPNWHPRLSLDGGTRIPRSGDTRKAPGDTRRPSRAPETPDPHPRTEPTPLRRRAPSSRRARRRAVAGHLHRAPLARGRPRRRPRTPGRRRDGHDPARAGLLRPDLGLHRAAQPCQGRHAPHPRPARAAARRRPAARRPRTELRGRAPLRPARTPRSRRAPGRPARRVRPHLRRGAGGVRAALGAAAAGPGRRRPDALPPARGARGRGRPQAA